MEKVESALSGIKLKFLLDNPEKNGVLSYQEVELEREIISFLANLCCFRSLEESSDPEAHGMDCHIGLPHPQSFQT